MKVKVKLGTLIHGTHRTEDLIPALLGELRLLSPEKAREWEDYHRLTNPFAVWVEEKHPYDERAEEALEDLFNRLSELAPPYVYFGAHQADGSDFGFWVDWPTVDLAVEQGELCVVKSGEPMPEDADEVLVVYDNGAHSLMTRTAWEERWWTA